MKKTEIAGLLKVSNYTHPVICNLCFMNPGTLLVRCVLSTKSYNPTNLENHINNKHSQVDCPHIFNRKAKALQLKVKEKTRKVCKSSIMAGFLTNNNTPEEALDEAQLLMYRFPNRASVAVRQGSQAALHSLLSYCVNNSQYLKH
jgi:hypothetical protein